MTVRQRTPRAPWADRPRPGRLVLLLAGLLLGAGGVASASSEFVFHHENVMGTSLELAVTAEGAASAQGAEARVLDEIDRLSAIFSGHDASSEFRRWAAAPRGPVGVSRELSEVLSACDAWRDRSGGAFEPRVGVLTELWSAAARAGREPSEAEIAAARTSMLAPAWRLDPRARTAERLAGGPLTLDAIAKGYIVEKACAAGLDPARGVRGLLLNVGGDMRACGETPRRVGLVDPRADSDSAEPSEVLLVRDRAVAFSGRSRRGFAIGGRWYSHILDPRTGRPADGVAGAAVVARSSSDADALATALNVLEPEAGVRLAESLDGVECRIVEASGRVFASRGWARLVAPVAQQGKSPAKPAEKVAEAPWDKFELAVDFEINNPDSGGGGRGRGRYRRPYVAVYVEDKKGGPVRTVVLWLSQGGAGPERWLPDLKRWYRLDDERKQISTIDLVHTISRPTRQPGKYSAVWDGKDDEGKYAPPGEYTVSIEAAREHGTYQIIRKSVTIAEKPFAEDLKGNVEIKSASLAYRRKAAPGK